MLDRIHQDADLFEPDERLASWQELSVELLNDVFTPLSWYERIEKLYKFFAQDDVLVTSSFGTKSVLLLRWLSEIRPMQPIHFIDTTYHFRETIEYRERLRKLFNLDIIEVLPDIEGNALTREEQYWIDHPKMCCSINKIAPLEPIVAQHRVWISGLMSYQTEFRKHQRVFEISGDILKFSPMIDMSEGEFRYYVGVHKLPRHPLELHGYGSIGCTHCTAPGKGRKGRWVGKEKSECGLHPNYFLRTKTRRSDPQQN